MSAFIAQQAALLLAAVEAPTPPHILIDAVENCRTVNDDGARLACFDRATAAMAEARARRDLLVTDRTEVRRTRRSLFGFVVPSFRFFGGSAKDDDEEEIKQIEGKVATVGEVGFNRLAVTLDDGTSWQTTEFARNFEPRNGDRITITKTAFGYSAKSGFGRVPVRRVK